MTPKNEFWSKTKTTTISVKAILSLLLNLIQTNEIKNQRMD